MDIYELLEVAPNASPDVIRAAYKSLVKKHHPDLGGDPAVMARINEATAYSLIPFYVASAIGQDRKRHQHLVHRILTARF